MSLRTKLLDVAARSLGGAVIDLKDPRAWESMTALRSKTGIAVTSSTAMNLSAVFACIRTSTETLSTLPVHVYQRSAAGRIELHDHPITRLLSRQANPDMPANVFREVIQGHLELRGKAFAEIVRDGRGDPVELWPIHPDSIQIQRGKKGALQYVYTPTNYIFPAAKILHFRGLGSNGIDSYSVISLARESLGLGLAAQEYGSRFFGQGTNMGGFLKHPKGLSDQAFERLKKEMNQKYKGLEKSHGLIILEEGLEYQKIGLTNEDAQFLETRKFQNSEVARWFGMKPHMIGDLERATFSNIEQQSIEAVTYTWRPRVVRLEQEIAVKLLREDEYIKFSLEGLLRGDVKSRYEAYKIAIENGWMNADEIRAFEDMNPQPEGMGKIFLAPLNMGDKHALLPKEKSETAEGSDGAAVDDTSAGVQLNGAQVSAATAIVEKVTAGKLPKDGGIAQLKILFNLTAQQATEMMGSAGDMLPADAARSNRSLFQQGESRAQIEYRSLSDRRLIADRYRGTVREAAQKLVNRETAFITEHIEGLTAEEIRTWLQESYGGFSLDVEELFSPIYRAIGRELYPVYAREVGSDPKHIPQGYEDAITRYISSFALRYTSSDKGQLTQIIDEAQEEFYAEIQTRMASWQESNAQKVEGRETTRIRNYLAKGAYAIAGITKIRSVAHGDNCPYCNALNGKIIGIKEFFIYKGEEFKPEGAQNALIPHVNRSHPPYHDGCDCDIVAEGLV